jgi:hypothetical protein
VPGTSCTIYKGASSNDWYRVGFGATRYITQVRLTPCEADFANVFIYVGESYCGKTPSDYTAGTEVHIDCEYVVKGDFLLIKGAKFGIAAVSARGH